MFSIVLVAPCLAWLPQPPRTLAEVVPWSDLIVIGTLSDVSETSNEGLTNGDGTLHVSRVLWGRAADGEELTLEWSVLSDLRVGPTHPSRANLEGIWLLQREPDETVRAYEPDGFRPSSDLEAVRAILRQQLRARIAPYLTGAVLEVGLRNAARDTLIVPGMRMEASSLVLDPRVHLNVSTSGGEEIRPKQGRLRHDPNMPPLAVPPSGDRVVRAQLVDVFPLVSRADYTLRLFIPGVGDTMSMRVHVNP
jgi:hypothetical protein